MPIWGTLAVAGAVYLRVEPAKQIYAERRARFVEQIGEGVAVFPGAHLVRRVNDVHHVFRQRSEVLYLTGFSHPDAVVVLSAKHFVLFVQPRDRDMETWNGRRPGVDGAVETYGADAAYPIGEFATRLPGLLQSAPRLYHRMGEDLEVDRMVITALQDLRAKARTGVSAPDEIVDPFPIVDEMRLRKDAHELGLMREAARITHDAHQAAARLARAGAHEYQLEAALAHVFRSRGGSGPAYPSIVASGENATILHYTENESRLRPGQMVLIDAGVEYAGYAADVTRTYPVDGRFASPHRDVYDAVLDAQQTVIEAVRPGTSLSALHDIALRCLCQSLIDLGALDCSVDEAISKEHYRAYYMHGTGHFLGLDVHDVGCPRVNGKPRPLEPGMVFTVEPGLYFRPDEEHCPESLRGIGVRIEDNVLVTETGCEILTDSIPKAAGDIEAWMQNDA